MNWHEATVIHWFHLVPGTQGGSQALNHPRGSGQLQANSASGLILQLYLPPHLVLSMSRSCFSSAAKRLKQAEEPKQGFGVAQAWIWRLTTLLASSGPESRFAQPPWACCVSEMGPRWSWKDSCKALTTGCGPRCLRLSSKLASPRRAVSVPASASPLWWSLGTRGGSRSGHWVRLRYCDAYPSPGSHIPVPRY